MDVSIIFVNYNTISLLVNAIDSVLEKTIGVKFEIIVVDNASKDNSEIILANKYQGKVIYILLPENIGFGRANNEGVKIAKGRNVLLLNPDTLLENNAIKILSDYLDFKSDLAAVGGNLYYEDGTNQPSFSLSYPSLRTNILNLILPNRGIYFNNSIIPKEVKTIFGAAIMIKKEVFNIVGGFNPLFFMYAEEDELCFRIRKKGYKLMNVPLAKITHLEGKSFQFSEQRLLRRLVGLRTLYKVSYSPTYNTLIRFVEYLIIITRLLIFKLLNNKDKVQYWKFMYHNRKWS